MGMRWKVDTIPLKESMDEGTKGQPFAFIVDDAGDEFVLTMLPVFSEDDEPQSSVGHAVRTPGDDQ
jgi:hypothetical protein